MTFHAGPDPFADADDFGMEIRRSGAGTPLTGGEVARLERDLSVLQRELREQVAEADQLSHLAHAMADSPDTMTLLHILVESANDACQSAVTGVTRLLDEGTAIGVVSAGRPALLPFFRNIRYPIANTLTEIAIAERRVVMHPRFSDFIVSLPDGHPLRELTNGFGAGAIILVPLIAQGDVIGVLTSLRLADQPLFSMRDERKLRVIADHAAVALRKSQMFEAVDAANQVKTAFLATISHELRTPLTALAGYGELLADGILGTLAPAQLDTVERMRAVTSHLAVMIDEILSYTNLEAGRERVVVTPVSPDVLLRDVAATMEPRARAHGLRLQWSVQPLAGVSGHGAAHVSSNGVAHAPSQRLAHADREAGCHEAGCHEAGCREAGCSGGAIPPLHTDADKLRQILANLCDNAIKFTPRGGTVTLCVAEGPSDVRFEVCDTGIGIAADQLSELFQPFKQLDSGLTRRYGGAGLGLHITRQLTELLGGEIEVWSELGAGSAFRVRIPR